MTVLQCGGCERFISVSIVPGGNPVALADPERWSATRRVCPSCRRSLCDRCAPAAVVQCPVCRAALAPGDGTAAARQPAGEPPASAEPSSSDEEELAALAWRDAMVEARRWLLAGILGALVLSAALAAKDSRATTALVALGALFAFAGGWNGMDRLARAGEVAPPWKALGVLVVLIPYIVVFPLGYFLWRSHARIAAAEEQQRAAAIREAARERAARRAAAARPPQAATAEQPAQAANAVPGPYPRVPRSPPDALQAVAYVKSPGVDRPDGTVLSMKLANGVELPKEQQPVIMACKGFAIVFVIDEGNHFRYANHSEMAAAGLTPQTMLTVGLLNLTRRVNGEPGLTVAGNGAVQALLMGGYFEASLLLLDELWDGPLKSHAPGGFVVALPARDICAFCDAGSAQGIQELRALSASVTARGDHCITPTLYARQGGSWVPLQ